MPCGGGHLGFPFGIKNRNFVEDLPMIIHVKFGFNCPNGFIEEAFSNLFPPLQSFCFLCRTDIQDGRHHKA
jgi:hypothetical protein